MTQTVVLLILALTSQEICLGEHLTLRGVGSTAAQFAQPYADCINTKYVAANDILLSCSGIRKSQRQAALEDSRTKKTRANIERAFRWLDKMTMERANCEARLKIER